MRIGQRQTPVKRVKQKKQVKYLTVKPSESSNCKGHTRILTPILLAAMVIVVIAAVLVPATDYTVYGAQEDTYIKVGLRYGSSSVSSAALVSGSGFVVAEVDDNGVLYELKNLDEDEINVVCQGSSVNIESKNGMLLYENLQDSECVFPLDYDEDGILHFGSTPYRGGMMFPANGGSSMMVLNYISMDHYLYGVLHSEMGHNNHIEALKAQAVAARSFAAANISVHFANGFNVCTTTHCQVYSGYQGEYERTNQAVDETSGLVMYSKGEPAAGYYYKNSGGYTQNSGDVWNDQLPYLQAVKDLYSPSYPWTFTISYSELQKRLTSAGKNPGTIHSVEITRRNEAGAVAELTVTGSSNTVVLTKDAVRSAISATDIKSTHFEISTGTGSSSQDSGGAAVVSDGRSSQAAGSELYILGSDGEVRSASTKGLHVTNGSGMSALQNGGTGSVSGGNGITFSGYGYGHGVGMAQDSAIAMAENGMGFEEILEFFFTDITIRKY